MVNSPAWWPCMRRNSPSARVKVDLIIVSRGITIRQNSTMRLTSTIMLKGLRRTFRIRFFSLVFVRGFLGRSFFATVTPLSDYCQGIAGTKSVFLFPQLSLCLHKFAVIRRKFVQTFAFSHFHYKEFYRPLSIDMFPILRKDFWPFSQLLWTLYKFII